MFKQLLFHALLLRCLLGDSLEEEFFFEDYGAWLVFRKIVVGTGSRFGVGYKFNVRYELSNIGSSSARNIKIEDKWDWEFVQRSRDQQGSEGIVFAQDELKPDETATFKYQLTPLAVGTVLPNRANLSYTVRNSEEKDVEFNAMSSNWVNSDDNELKLTTGLERRIVSENPGNDKLIILSAFQYSRAISSTFMWWLGFVVICVIAIVYPLYQFDKSGGDSTWFPFGAGRFLSFLVKCAMMIINNIKRASEKKKE